MAVLSPRSPDSINTPGSSSTSSMDVDSILEKYLKTPLFDSALKAANSWTSWLKYRNEFLKLEDRNVFTNLDQQQQVFAAYICELFDRAVKNPQQTQEAKSVDLFRLVHTERHDIGSLRSKFFLDDKEKGPIIYLKVNNSKTLEKNPFVMSGAEKKGSLAGRFQVLKNGQISFDQVVLFRSRIDNLLPKTREYRMRRQLELEKRCENFDKEARFYLEHSQLPGVVKSYGLYADEKKPYKKYIALECLDVDLHQIVLKLTPQERVSIACKFLEILKRLEEEQILHRDLKLENILVSRKSDGSVEVRIIDWSYSLKNNGCNGRSKYNLPGTPIYFSPEGWEVVSRGIREKPLDFQRKFDIWAGFIVLLHVLADPIEVYTKLDKKTFEEVVERGVQWYEAESGCAEDLKKLWEENISASYFHELFEIMNKTKPGERWPASAILRKMKELEKYFPFYYLTREQGDERDKILQEKENAFREIKKQLEEEEEKILFFSKLTKEEREERQKILEEEKGSDKMLQELISEDSEGIKKKIMEEQKKVANSAFWSSWCGLQ